MPKVFIDTNILIYSIYGDARQKEKVNAALTGAGGQLVLSMQVLSRAGIPNKETSRRDWIKLFLDDYTNEKLKEDFYSLTPGERIKYAVKLMEFDTPKLRNIEEKQFADTIRVIYDGREEKTFERRVVDIPPVKFTGSR